MLVLVPAPRLFPEAIVVEAVRAGPNQPSDVFDGRGEAAELPPQLNRADQGLLVHLGVSVLARLRIERRVQLASGDFGRDAKLGGDMSDDGGAVPGPARELAARDFKTYDTQHVMKHLVWAFPKLVSHQRFVELMPAALVPLCAYLRTRKGPCGGISFIDSTKLSVCHNRRSWQHRVFAGGAARAKLRWTGSTVSNCIW